jgi:flagella basal body P-ring formation protein FlgA
MRPYAIIIFLLFSCEACLTGAMATAGPRTDTRTVSMVQTGADHRGGGGDAAHPSPRELSTERIAGAIQKYLEEEWSERIKSVSVAVLDPSDAVLIPAGAAELRVLPSASDEGLGRRVFHLAVTLDRKPWKTIQAIADISATVDAVVPTRFLKHEELIEAGDLKTVKVRVPQLNHPFVTNRDEVVGKSAARPLQPDTLLRAGFVKPALVIKKGDRVLIEVRRGGLSIQTYGITKSNGQVGQTIMVANVDSGRELRAKVVAPNLVQVEF